MTGGVAWLGRHRDNANDPTNQNPTPVPFVSLTPVRGASVPYGGTDPDPFQLASVVTAGDRAFVTWQQSHGSGVTQVGAIDLAKGQPAWPTRSLGRFNGGGVIALPEALVLIGTPDNGSTGQLVVINPADGTERWRRPLDLRDDPIFFGSALLLAPRAEDGTPGTRQTVAIDWRTGKPLWSIPAPPGGVARTFGMYGAADLNGSRSVQTAGLGPNFNDHRLVQMSGDHKTRIYDAETGKLIANGPDIDATGAMFFGYEGRLFQWRPDQHPQEVRMYTADQPGAGTVVYTGSAGATSVGIISLIPCGANRLCLLEQPVNGDQVDATQLVVVDLNARKELWRRPVRGAERVIALGDRIATSGGLAMLDKATSNLFDPTGKQLLQPDDQRATVAWVNGGRDRREADGAGQDLDRADRLLVDRPVPDLPRTDRR